MFMFKTNEPVKVTHLQKLANQSTLNGVLVIEIICNSFNENKKNFSRKARNAVIEKRKKRYGQRKLYISTRFH